MKEICLPARKKNSVSLSTLSLSTLSVSKAKALLSRSQLSLSQKLKLSRSQLSRSQLSYSLGLNSLCPSLSPSQFPLTGSGDHRKSGKKFVSHLPLLNKNFPITLQVTCKCIFRNFFFQSIQVLRVINTIFRNFFFQSIQVLRIINTVVCFKVVLEKK